MLPDHSGKRAFWLPFICVKPAIGCTKLKMKSSYSLLA
jgi:hypothetical protein